MNILYLINHAGNGGSEKYVLKLAEALSREHKIFFVYNEDGPLVSRMERICEASLRLELRSPFDFRAARSLARFARENSVDIIHAQYPRENYIAIISRMFYIKPRVIYTAHLNRRDGVIRRALNLFVTRGNASAIAVCTSGERLLAENGYSRRKIRLIFNGADEPEATSVSNVSVLDGDGFSFLCLSRLSEEKGLRFLLDSVRELKETSPEPFTLYIAGDGPMRKELEAYAEGLGLGGRVSFLGYREDVGALLSSAGALINSSPMEALSLALTEGLAYSLPLIVTAIGGNLDIVNENTNCGISVEYGDAGEMAAAMRKMAEDADFRAVCAENARLAFERIFCFEKTLAGVASIYEDALKKSKRS